MELGEARPSRARRPRTAPSPPRASSRALDGHRESVRAVTRRRNAAADAATLRAAALIAEDGRRTPWTPRRRKSAPPARDTYAEAPHERRRCLQNRSGVGDAARTRIGSTGRTASTVERASDPHAPLRPLRPLSLSASGSGFAGSASGSASSPLPLCGARGLDRSHSPRPPRCRASSRSRLDNGGRERGRGAAGGLYPPGPDLRRHVHRPGASPSFTISASEPVLRGGWASGSPAT